MDDLFARVPTKPAPRVAPARPRQGGVQTENHLCAICGAAAGFGFGVFLRRGEPGRWACLAHRDDVEGMR